MHHARHGYGAGVRWHSPNSAGRRLAARAKYHRKYWLARVPFLWSKQNVYMEVELA
jgi:hypothetical protein